MEDDTPSQPPSGTLLSELKKNTYIQFPWLNEHVTSVDVLYFHKLAIFVPFYLLHYNVQVNWLLPISKKDKRL